VCCRRRAAGPDLLRVITFKLRDGASAARSETDANARCTACSRHKCLCVGASLAAITRSMRGVGHVCIPTTASSDALRAASTSRYFTPASETFQLEGDRDPGGTNSTSLHPYRVSNILCLLRLHGHPRAHRGADGRSEGRFERAVASADRTTDLFRAASHCLEATGLPVCIGTRMRCVTNYEVSATLQRRTVFAAR
jgi:hypothetical protein